jgi:hypothetical protein
VQSAPAGCTVGLAAMTVKGYDIFEVQFNELVAEFRKTLTPAERQGTLFPAEAT